jgi:cytoskeleton protein RodZ
MLARRFARRDVTIGPRWGEVLTKFSWFVDNYARGSLLPGRLESRFMPEEEKPLQAGATFGDELRREREIRGISLKEIADATKVSKRFLEAIEKNDYRNLPAPVFTRGFIREYARYVGLSSDEMVTRYMHFVELTGDAGAIAEPERERPQLQAIAREPYRPQSFGTIGRTEPGRGGWWLIALALAALAGGAAFLVMTHRLPLTHARSAIASLGRSKTRKPSRQPGKTAETPPASAPVSTSTAAPGTTAVAAATPLHLLVEITADSWVNLQADGRSVMDREMRDGETRSFDAEKEFRFQTIGNAGGVVLTLNGVHIPPLGNQGEVLHDTVYDRAWLADATSTAGHTRRRSR